MQEVAAQKFICGVAALLPGPAKHVTALAFTPLFCHRKLVWKKLSERKRNNLVQERLGSQTSEDPLEPDVSTAPTQYPGWRTTLVA